MDWQAFNYIKKLVGSINALGFLNVSVQERNTDSLDLFFLEATSPPTTLAVATMPDVNDYDNVEIEVVNDTECSVGDYLGLFGGETGDFYFGEIQAKLGAGVLRMDTPIDKVFAVGNAVICGNRDMNVDGSTTSRAFEIRAGGAASTLKVHITRIMIQMVTDTTPQLTDFGDIPLGLVNGIVLRSINGTIKNTWNLKTNAEIATLAFDINVYQASNPGQGIDGLGARNTFGGDDKHGVVIELEPGDSLQVLIRDDLSSLLTFRLMAQGHVVQSR